MISEYECFPYFTSQPIDIGKLETADTVSLALNLATLITLTLQKLTSIRQVS